MSPSEIVQAKEILNNIGGLDEEIEMLVEATKTVLGPKPTRYAHIQLTNSSQPLLWGLQWGSENRTSLVFKRSKVV